jgi:hypothetical protein
MNDNDDTAPSAGRVVSLIHSLSATLANIDLEHKGELERLALSTVEADFAALIMATLRKRHQQRREPYLRHLEMLRERARQDALFAEWSGRSAKLVAAE